MSQKARNITGWVLTALLSFLFISSAAMKLSGGDAATAAAASMGLSTGTIQVIGLVELGSLVLFIIPRTGVLGTLLLAAYLGGAIATHLEHQQPIYMAAAIQALVWITATIRFPELSKRLAGNKSVEREQATLPSARLAA